MKNYSLILLALCFLALSFESKAQFEVKINPIGTLFNNPEISGEFLLDDNIGIAAGVGLRYGDRTILGENYTSNGGSLKILPRYYFSPKQGADRFYAGIYAKVIQQKYRSAIFNQDIEINRSKVALGFFSGFKWVGDSGVLLDINAGFGRAFINRLTSDQIQDTALSVADLLNINFDLIGSISLGYRIGGPKN